jgi:hypothetical protein
MASQLYLALMIRRASSENRKPVYKHFKRLLSWRKRGGLSHPQSIYSGAESNLNLMVRRPRVVCRFFPVVDFVFFYMRLSFQDVSR